MIMRRSRRRKIRSATISLVLSGVAGLPLAAAAGDWTILPRIAGQETFTDNLFFTPTNRRADFITSISPGISISGESTRLRATVDYSPTLALFALTPNENFLGHNLYANATATIVPDLFFLDGRGYMSMQPNSPALTLGLGAAPAPAPGAVVSPTSLTPGVPNSLLSQVSSFSASPYLAHRFGGFGSAELRYTVSDTNFSGTPSNNL